MDSELTREKLRVLKQLRKDSNSMQVAAARAREAYEKYNTHLAQEMREAYQGTVTMSVDGTSVTLLSPDYPGLPFIFGEMIDDV